MPERGRTSDQYIDMQQALHHLELSDRDTETRWNNIVPIKVNILVWRIRLDRLPTRDNLIVRGIDILSILCPSCGDAMEDNDNVFVKCVIAVRIWERIFRWIDMDQPMFGVIADVFN
ncbi:RNA-directed DNA polymerase, eukaryota, reverse transcriptase zinc-binding domain protein [Tanacetum coccineum]